MHVGLVADVENKVIGRCIKNAMKRNCQLDHAEIGAEMAARLGQDRDQLIAYFLRELREVIERDFFTSAGELIESRRRAINGKGRHNAMRPLYARIITIDSKPMRKS